MKVVTDGRSFTPLDDLLDAIRYYGVDSASPTRMVIIFNSTTYTITGTDLQTNGGRLVSGTIDEVVARTEHLNIEDDPVPEWIRYLNFSISTPEAGGLNLDVELLRAAAGASGRPALWAITDEWIMSPRSNIMPSTLLRLLGPDTYTGVGDANNRLAFGRGDDKVSGGRGHDTIWGGLGDDALKGGEGNDVLSGGPGNDSLDGGAGTDWVNFEFNAPFESEPNTRGVIVDLARGLARGHGNDTLSSIEGLIGSWHADTFYGSSRDNELDGQGGNDVIDGRGGNDQLRGGDGKDTLVGGTGDDDLKGGDGKDTLIGGTGDDTINGGYLPDRLYGGGGRDALVGEHGNDVFLYKSLADSQGSHRDAIVDFDDRQDDTIDLSLIFRGRLDFIGSAAFGDIGQVRVRTSGADVYVEVNASGGLAADFTIRLVQTAIGDMTSADFVL